MRPNRPSSLLLLAVSTLFAGCGGYSAGNPTPPTTPPATLTITTTSPLTQGVAGVAYSATLAATGGTAPYTWSVTSGTLPTGLSLSSAGVLSGTPTAAASSTFTVQVADAASTPQKATLAATLTINAPLAITTTSPLPAGVVGTAYSTTLAASGGVAPYSWTTTAGTLPAGLVLSTAGVLSGTPTAPAAAAFTIQVTDAETTPQKVSLPVTLMITPAPGVIADGHYAFLFAGTTPQGDPLVPGAVAITGAFTVQSGAVISGEYDENTNSETTAATARVATPITGGTIANGSDGLGQLVLQTAAGSITFALATPPSAVPGSDSAIRIIEFDDTTGTGTRGSGVLKPAQPSLATSAISGNFAFLVSGADNTGRQQALVGSFSTDGAGNILGGLADSNEAGDLKAFPTVQGVYSVDSTGRGTFGIVLAPGGVSENFMYHYSFYEVSPGEWFTVAIDPPTVNAPLASGSVVQQTGPFTTASLPTTSVLELNGLTPGTGGGTVPDITAGFAASDGQGNVSFTFDEYNGALTTGQALGAAAYTVDPATGRTITAADGYPLMYIISPNSAFVLGADQSTSSGMIEAQTGAPFSNASFSGMYLGGSLPLATSGVLNENGVVAADGNGNVTILTNRSTSQGLVLYQTVTGSYATDNSGRVLVTTPDGVTRIFYIVSPTRAAYLTSDGGGYLGSFEQ